MPLITLESRVNDVFALVQENIPDIIYHFVGNLSGVFFLQWSCSFFFFKISLGLSCLNNNWHRYQFKQTFSPPIKCRAKGRSESCFSLLPSGRLMVMGDHQYLAIYVYIYLLICTNMCVCSYKLIFTLLL